MTARKAPSPKPSTQAKRFLKAVGYSAGTFVVLGSVMNLARRVGPVDRALSFARSGFTG